MESDVVVIGAGVAGCLIAWDLAEKGHSVTLIEAGARVEYRNALAQWAGSETKTLSSPYLDTEGTRFAPFPDGPKDYLYSEGSSPFKSTYVRKAGGTTLHWQGSTPRLIPSDFRLKSQFGIGIDWPINYDHLEPWYTLAESTIGVSGNHEEWDGFHGAYRSGPFPMSQIWNSYSDQLIAASTQGLEIGGVPIRVRSTPQARNSQPFQDRPPCAGNSTCIPICPIGAKYDAGVHLRLALKAGVTLLDTTVATNIVLDNGKITGVEIANWSASPGLRSLVRGRKYVVAAHALESARLLLISGVGNPNLVGRNLMDHPTGQIVGMSKQPVYGFRGPPVTAGIDEWRDGPWRDASAAWKISLGNDGHGRFRSPQQAVQQWMSGGTFGKALRDKIEFDVPRMVRMSWATEQLPDMGNRVELDRNNLDGLGLPRLRTTYTVNDYSLRAFVKIRSTILEIFEHAGIRSPEMHANPNDYGGSGHILGTCRMGKDPSNSVVDQNCKVHGHENLFLVGSGVFPTGGTANPTLTVAALALRASSLIHGEL